MLLETEEGIWARADARVVRLLMEGGRAERRLQAAERTVAAAFRRVAALRQRRCASAAREQIAVVRRLEQELSQAWGSPLHIRMAEADRAKPGSAGPTRKMAMLAGVSKRAIRTYQVPMVDDRGRVGPPNCNSAISRNRRSPGSRLRRGSTPADSIRSSARLS